MITACRIAAFILLAFVAIAGHPAAASQTGDEPLDRILVADASLTLRSYLSGSGFTVESTERLDALGFSLTIVRPPRTVQAPAALRDLRAKFPTAIIALDDPYRLAHDARLRHRHAARTRAILAAIGWPPDDGEPGAGVRVGVIDGSVDPAHPALRRAAIVQRSFTSGKSPATDMAHGTAIGAMLVGTSNDRSVSGLLRGATLYHASIFQKSRQGPKASSADFLRAVDWLLESDVTVINASITSSSKNPVVLYAMSMLSHRKAIVVAAAGNSGPTGPPVYPAAIESAFAVTAVSVGGEAYPQANTGSYIDIAAPGIDLPTISRKIASGTSLATPFVTAAVARMVQMCGIAPRAAQQRLQANARDLGARGWDPHFGWGLLQAPRCSPAGTQVSAAGAESDPPDSR